MQALWRMKKDSESVVGFFFDNEQVMFDYSIPFDRNTGERSNTRGWFSTSEFARCMKALQADHKGEMKSSNGGTLELKRTPGGGVTLSFWTGGYALNVGMLDLRATPEELAASLAMLPKPSL